MPHSLIIIFLAVLLVIPMAANAGQCRIHFEPHSAVPLEARPEGQMDFESDELILQDGIYHFSGKVRVYQEKRLIRAEDISFDSNKNTVNARKEVEINEPNLSLKSETANIDINSRQANLQNVEYQLPQQHGHGKAEKISIEGQNIIKLDRAYYTTCDPDREHWKIQASKMHFNNQAETGSATHIVLWVGKMPVMYFPYIQFPIGDKRKSGFLAPRIKLQDSSSGGGFSLPYYFNIAPNKDATVTPRLLTRRGLQMLNEFRYLNQFSNTVVLFDYLPDDEIYGTDRSFGRIHSSGGIRKKIAFDLLYNEVSDPDYFIDLGNSLYSSNTAHLERKADIQYKSGALGIFVRGQEYQTLDQNIPLDATPYQRLPQLQINYGITKSVLRGNLDMEFVNFKRSASTASLRSHIAPRVGLDLKNVYGYLRPTLHYYFTQYHSKSAGGQSDAERQLPSYQLDGGLFFERQSEWRKRSILQTLEPRLSYLKVPYRVQDNIPVFDTSRLDDNFNNIFLPNRYSGIDRIGDTHQLSLGLVHRWIDNDSGAQNLKVELGHVYFFEDRQVSLPGEPVQTDPESAWLSSMQANLSGRSQINAEYVWDPNSNTSVRSLASFNYRSKRQRYALSYRKEKTQLEQVAVLANGKIATSWQYTGQLVYDLKQNEKLEWWGGLEYSSCCWAVRFAKRSFINGTGIKDEHLLLEFELRGMSKVGEKLSEMFQF